jgi:hypothetical protein
MKNIVLYTKEEKVLTVNSRFKLKTADRAFICEVIGTIDGECFKVVGLTSKQMRERGISLDDFELGIVKI